MSRHFMQSHIRRVLGCLAVTYHLHFWQNDRDLLRATAVIQGRNGYRNKSQYRKLIIEKTIIQPFLPVEWREGGGSWGHLESYNVTVLPPPPPPAPLQFLFVVLNCVVSKQYNPSLSLLIYLVLYSSILSDEQYFYLYLRLPKQREHCTTLALSTDHHEPKPGLYALVQ